jgi:hypothetical protein
MNLLNDEIFDYKSDVVEDREPVAHFEQKVVSVKDEPLESVGYQRGVILISLLITACLAGYLLFRLLMAGVGMDAPNIAICACFFLILCSYRNKVDNIGRSMIFAVMAALLVLWVRAFVLFKYDALVIESHWLCISPVFVALFSSLFSGESLSRNRS